MSSSDLQHVYVLPQHVDALVAYATRLAGPQPDGAHRTLAEAMVVAAREYAELGVVPAFVPTRTAGPNPLPAIGAMVDVDLGTEQDLRIASGVYFDHGKRTQPRKEGTPRYWLKVKVS